jgi:hypothetical protein
MLGQDDDMFIHDRDVSEIVSLSPVGHTPNAALISSPSASSIGGCA